MTRLPRPATLRYGALCIAASLAIGVAILFFAWREPRAALLSLVIVGALTVAALYWSWPRWGIALLAVLSVAATLPQVAFQLSYRLVIPVATVTQFTLELAGCIFLFLPSSHRWYRRPRVSEES